MCMAVAPALTRRPFGVGIRPTLHCGEHGPRRLSELGAQDMNRGHVLALESGARDIRLSLLARGLQPIAADDGAFEGTLLHIELPDREVPAVAQHRERDTGEPV